MSGEGEGPALDAASTIDERDRDGMIGIVRTLAREVRDDFKRIIERLDALPRIESALQNLHVRAGEIEHRLDRHDDRLDRGADRLDNHEQRIAQAEATIASLSALLIAKP